MMKKITTALGFVAVAAVTAAPMPSFAHDPNAKPPELTEEQKRHKEEIALAIERCDAQSINSVPGKAWMTNYGWRYPSASSAQAAYLDLVNNTPPWPSYMLPSVARLEPGRKFQMAFSKGQPNDRPGGFGTFDRIDSVETVRADLAVQYVWKEDVDRVVTFRITKPTMVLVGPVGPQVDQVRCKLLQGRYSQFQLLMAPAQRNDYFEVVSEVKLAQPIPAASM